MINEPSASDIEKGGRLWRVRVQFVAPTAIPMPLGGGPPTQLTFENRIPEQTRNYDDVIVNIRCTSPAAQSPGAPLNPGHVLCHLIADVVALDPHAAIVALASKIESVIDLMSFEMGTAISPGQTDVVDISEPVAVGDEREIVIFSGSPFHRHIRQVEMQVIQGLLHGRLPDIKSIPDAKVAAALRWVVKSLETDLIHDQFIFLWIALEILSDKYGNQVKMPYSGPCQHEIPNCPECGRETSQMVRGETLRKYLKELKVSGADANSLWKMRQIMHRAFPFKSEKLETLPALLQILRAAVVASLKVSLGWVPEAPPVVATSGLSITPALGVGGTRIISVEDITPLMSAEVG